MTTKVFCFGSEHFDGDEIAFRLAPMLDIPGYEFIISESPSDILRAEEDLIIMDAVEGVEHVCFIDNVDDLSVCKTLTCHDLDLGFYLKLLKETGKITTVKIIALPFGEKDYEKLKKDVRRLLSQ